MTAFWSRESNTQKKIENTVRFIISRFFNTHDRKQSLWTVEKVLKCKSSRRFKSHKKYLLIAWRIFFFYKNFFLLIPRGQFLKKQKSNYFINFYLKKSIEEYQKYWSKNFISKSESRTIVLCYFLATVSQKYANSTG